MEWEGSRRMREMETKEERDLSPPMVQWPFIKPHGDIGKGQIIIV